MKAVKNKKLCKLCGEKKAIYFTRGKVKCDRHHDLCPRCWRRLLDKYREV
jgi:hypothetical protein